MEESFEYLRIYKFVEDDGVKRLVLVAKIISYDPLVVGKFVHKMFNNDEYIFAYDM